jgi:hypothetical protein
MLNSLKQIMKLREAFEQVRVPASAQLRAPNPKTASHCRETARKRDADVYVVIVRTTRRSRNISQLLDHYRNRRRRLSRRVFCRVNPFIPPGSVRTAHDFLIGADDLAAHAYNSQSGKEILTASMIGRKDLLFDPSRKHVSRRTCFRNLGNPICSSKRRVAPKCRLFRIYFPRGMRCLTKNGVGFERSRLLSEYSFSEFCGFR